MEEEQYYKKYLKYRTKYYKLLSKQKTQLNQLTQLTQLTQLNKLTQRGGAKFVTNKFNELNDKYTQIYQNQLNKVDNIVQLESEDFITLSNYK
jgi:hypothetical protein